MYDVLKYIHNNIDKKLILTDVAKHFGYSKWYFCSKFHSYTGKSFAKYVRHLRLQLASLDILTGKSSTDVALDYGYDTLGGFNKAFLAEFGCLPREYKSHVKKAQLYYERRKLTMYQLTDRCEILRQLVTGKNDYEDYYCMQQRVYSALGMVEAYEKNLTNTEITAYAIANVLDKFTPVIIPGELIVGFNYPDSKYHHLGIRENIHSAENIEIMKQNGICNSDIEKFLKIKDKQIYLKPYGNEFMEFVEPKLNDAEKLSQKEWAGIGRCISCNHSVINYEKVLKLGFKGILKEIEEYEAKNGSSPFYTSLKMV